MADSNARPDADNRLFVDHVQHALVEFPYGNYGCDDFPALDPIEGEVSEVVRDMAKEVAAIAAGYFRSRAEDFTRAAAPTSLVIAEVLHQMADEIEATESP